MGKYWWFHLFLSNIRISTNFYISLNTWSAEMVYDELCRHLKHQKSPISKFIIISSKQFFLFSLSPSYGIIGNISPQSEIELIVNQWRSQKQQTLVLSSCLQKHTSEGNPVHQLIVGNHSTNITQNCKHYIHFSFRHVRK